MPLPAGGLKSILTDVSSVSKGIKGWEILRFIEKHYHIADDCNRDDEAESDSFFQCQSHQLKLEKSYELMRVEVVSKPVMSVKLLGFKLEER